MKNRIFFPRISFALIIVCFMLPFVTVKCNKVEIAKLNGFNLISGYTVGDGSEEAKKYDPEPFVLISFVLAVAGLVMAFLKFKGNKVASLVVSIIGFLSLLIFYFTIRNNVPGEGKFIIIISMGIGYYLTTIGFLANSIFFGFNMSAKKDVFVEEDKKEVVE